MRVWRSKRWLRVAIKTVLFVVCVFAVAELYIRFDQNRALGPAELGAREYHRMVLSRMHAIWLDVFREPDPLLPPYVVFANRDIHDDERLKRVLEDSRIAFVGERSSYDFLQSPERASSTAYIVTMNSLGFRGPERDAEKPAGTFRIVVLGSYHPFGLGVGDDENYPALLEKKLMAATDRTVEVWNGGKPAGTAIVGLAQMRHEILEYSPDLIVLDYGFIDTLVLDDNIFPPAMRFPDSFSSKVFRVVAEPFILGLNRSALWNNFFFKQFIEKPRMDKFDRFRETIGETIAIAKEHGIPVVIVSQLQVIPPNTFDVFADGTDVQVVKVRDVFAENPPDYPDAAEWQEGYWSRTWLAELNPEVVDAKSYIFEYYPYRLDLFQLSAIGQDVLASSLSALIQTSYIR